MQIRIKVNNNIQKCRREVRRVKKERNILNKAEEVMELLKPLTFRERKTVLKILTDLIDVDTWISTTRN